MPCSRWNGLAPPSAQWRCSPRQHAGIEYLPRIMDSVRCVVFTVAKSWRRTALALAHVALAPARLPRAKSGELEPVKSVIPSPLCGGGLGWGVRSTTASDRMPEADARVDLRAACLRHPPPPETLCRVSAPAKGGGRICVKLNGTRSRADESRSSTPGSIAGNHMVVSTDHDPLGCRTVTYFRKGSLAPRMRGPAVCQPDSFAGRIRSVAVSRQRVPGGRRRVPT